MSSSLLDALATSPLLPAVGTLAMVAGGVVFMTAIFSRRYERIIPAAIILVVSIGVNLYSRITKTSDKNTGSPASPNAVPTSTPSLVATSAPVASAPVASAPVASAPVASAPVASATPSASSSSDASIHLPWDVLGFIAVAIVLVAAVAIGIVFVVHSMKRKKNRSAENTRAWEELMSRYGDIRSQWASYELDMAKIIDFPLMSDMREPTVVSLHKALKNASSLAPKTKKEFGYASIDGSAFLAAVNDLEVAFNTAEQTAKKVAWERFSADERRRLSTAKNLLALAMDSGASPSERQAAYKRVFKELQGLIEFPEKARLAIEERHLLSIAA